MLHIRGSACRLCTSQGWRSSEGLEKAAATENQELLTQQLCCQMSHQVHCPEGICNRYAAALLPSKPCRAPYRDMVINHAGVLQL